MAKAPPALFHNDIIFIPNPDFPNEAIRSASTRRLVESLLSEAANKAASLAPVDTGYLASTVGYEINDELAEGQIFAEAPYAAFVEFGTSEMAAQPYLRPAMDSVVPRG